MALIVVDANVFPNHRRIGPSLEFLHFHMHYNIST
jgi:hypothetical protein